MNRRTSTSPMELCPEEEPYESMIGISYINKQHPFVILDRCVMENTTPK